MKITTNTYADSPPPSYAAMLRWDVPDRNQGQMIEVAYADPIPGRGPADEGSLWQRVTDRSASPPEIAYGKLKRGGRP